MSNIFQSIRVKKPSKTNFDMSHENLLTTEAGRLTPVQLHKTLPFEWWRGRTEAFIRLAPLMYPIYARLNSYVHHMFCPNRLLWKGWQEFITKGKDGNSDLVYPRLRLTPAIFRTFSDFFSTGSLYDYLGFPVPPDFNVFDVSDTSTKIFDLDLLPFLAYYKVWQNYYADQNLTNFELEDDWLIPEDCGILSYEDAVSGTFSDGVSIRLFLEAILKVRYRAWEKDYFTSSLPTPQRGDDVRLPIAGTASVDLNSASINAGSLLTPPITVVDSKGNKVPNLGSFTTTNQGRVITDRDTLIGFSTPVDRQVPLEGKATVDMSDARMVTINELRRGFAVQKFKEVLARTGYRYRDFIFGMFGGLSSDSRLQRPEYLGGGKSPIMIGEVLQTSQSTEQSPLGEMAGKGVGMASDNGFKYKPEEHGYIISILSIIPRSSYSQGVSRLHQQFDALDYANPLFAHLGEQEVKNRELYQPFNKTSSDFNDADKTFGYQSRFAEYKYVPNSIHGDFRGNLNRWHLSRQFYTTPGLNEYFVTVSPMEVNRVFAVESVNGESIDHFWIQVYNKTNALRPLPKYGTPRI